jgi:hypothetical protein
VFKATMALVKTRKMLLLLPLFFNSGVQAGFASGVFTHDVIMPALGISNIGYFENASQLSFTLTFIFILYSTAMS